MSQYGKRKNKGFFEKLEDGIRTVSTHIQAPKTGEGASAGRQQGMGEASWDNSSAFKKRRGRS